MIAMTLASIAPWRKNIDQDSADQSSANAFNQDNDSALDQTDNTSSTTDLSPVFLPMAHPGAAETALPVWRFSSSPTTSGDASNSSQPDEGSLPQADASISANATAANPSAATPT